LLDQRMAGDQVVGECCGFQELCTFRGHMLLNTWGIGQIRENPRFCERIMLFAAQAAGACPA
jgi:hypothetical protein